MKVRDREKMWVKVRVKDKVNIGIKSYKIGGGNRSYKIGVRVRSLRG